MSYHYSKTSKERLQTCHHLLIDLFEDAIEIVDIKIVCGSRNEQEQTAVFESGTSKVEWPDSYHNHVIVPAIGDPRPESFAVDAIPCPVDWDNLYPFYHLAGIIKGMAKLRGIKIEWGGDWKTFKDFPHYQLSGRS